MSKNKLKLNQEKTEFIVLGKAIHRNKMTTDSIKVGESTIKSSKFVRNLGAYLNQDLSMKAHVNQLCISCYFQLTNIQYIGDNLSTEAAKTVVQALITSKPDYCNSISYDISNKLLDKLQRIQNCAARLIVKSKTAHISAHKCLKALHWLPVRYRISYKIILLVFKSLKGLEPPYLQDMLTPYTTSHQLRSSGNLLPTVPKTKLKTCGDRAFSVTGPKLWNDLPIDLRMCTSMDIF